MRFRHRKTKPIARTSLKGLNHSDGAPAGWRTVFEVSANTVFYLTIT